MRNNERKKSLGEVFTPLRLIEEMLDRLPSEMWSDPAKTFCDPSSGNGNFLVEVVRRKIKAGSTPLQALQTTYGVDIMLDNTTEAHRRLLKVASEASGIAIHPEWAWVALRNMVKADSLQHSSESLARGDGWEFPEPERTLERARYVEILVEEARKTNVW